ncbi:MAG: argininosuccinate lyase [Polyangiaceae bacterium]|nr:argininosuccinate lyase [Polyangiaceae bacterium]
MSNRLWDKGGAADAAMLRFTARDDYVLDEALLVHDVAASAAHVRGLMRIGALEAGEADAVVAALDVLRGEIEKGAFRLTPEHEDGHTAIELWLVERLGDLGKKVHLGRSRNDQVLVAMRSYERAELSVLASLTTDCAKACLDLAAAETWTVMPGYTHLQRAVPQTVGHWAAGFAEGFVESARVLVDARRRVNASPLGAAAGYGVNLPLDRDGVAHDLGFDRVQLNPLWSQTSRGMTEVVILGAVWHAVALARRLAWDLSLFTTAEFGFVRLPVDLTTGSSIMPNKRNPDLVELVRASCAVVEGAIVELMSITSLPSGYHRDLQLTKGPLMRAFAEAKGTIATIARLVPRIELVRDRMAAAVTKDTLATDRAVDLARSGMPFREAYKKVGAEIGSGEEAAGAAAEASVRARSSLGAAGNLGLERIAKDLERVIEEVTRAPASA